MTTSSTPARRDDALAIAIAYEAVRLNWDRASQRIVQVAQERVARERADLLPLRG